LVYGAGVGVYLAPVVAGLRGHLGPDLGDTRLNLYFLSWVAHCLETGLDGLWSPPFFFPSRGVLAFSDHLIGPGAFVWLAGAFGIGRVTAFNLLLLASFWLSGIATFWLVRRLGVGLWPALLGGWFVAFSHLRWDEISHYQVLRAQWIPVVLWCFDRFLVRPGAKSAAAFLAAYLLHVSGGTYLTYMIHVPMLVILLVRWREAGWRDFLARPRLTWLAGAAAGALALLAPFVWGYVAEWGDRTIARTPMEIRGVGALLSSFAALSPEAPIQSLGILDSGARRGALFPGFVLLAGCSALAAAWLKPTAGAKTGRVVGLSCAAAAGIALSAWGLRLADAHTMVEHEAAWLAELGLRRYNGPRLLVALGLVVLCLALRRWPTRGAVLPIPVDPFAKPFLLGGAACLALAIPVGFTTVHRLLPGMSGIRVSHRFFVFALLPLAYLGAVGIDRLTKGRRPFVRVALLTLFSLAAAVEAAPRRMRWEPVPEHPSEFPAYAHHLATNGDVTAYLEIPMSANHRDTEWMHNQTLHWKPLANGYSARFTSTYRRIAKLFDPFLDRDELRRLRGLGISHLVIHWREDRIRARTGWRRFEDEVNAAVGRGELRGSFEDERVSIYRIEATVEAPATATER
jgi:hypothetical protein